MKDIKISLDKICFTYKALIPKNMLFSLLNKCTFRLVEQMIKILEKNNRVIIKGPFIAMDDHVFENPRMFKPNGFLYDNGKVYRKNRIACHFY